MPKALFFGSIGVLAETSDLQRRAFNAAFKKNGLDWHWGEDEYHRLLTSSGGKRRIEDYAEARGESIDAQAIYDNKLRQFETLVTPGSLSPRAGVEALIREAVRAGIKLGFVTSTHRAQVDLIFEGLTGSVRRGDFDYIGHRGRVARGKPAPDIYLDALQALDLRCEDVIAVEDTPESAEAALEANITTMAFPGEAAKTREFPAGMTVLERLDQCILQLETA